MSTVIVAAIYLLLTVFLMNFVLEKNTLFGSYPFVYKWNVSIALIEGMWTAMTHFSLLLLVLIALLTGANLTLLFNRISVLKQAGGIHIATGGGSLLGFVSSGCAACGLPILSLLGFSGSFLALPFHGEELSFLALVLLIISFFLLSKSNANVTCKFLK